MSIEEFSINDKIVNKSTGDIAIIREIKVVGKVPLLVNVAIEYVTSGRLAAKCSTEIFNEFRHIL